MSNTRATFVTAWLATCAVMAFPGCAPRGQGQTTASPPPASPTPHVRLALAAAAGLAPDAWGAPVTIDGRRCRELKAGHRGEIPLQPWWPGDGLRPPPGSAYLARILFKDVAKAPIKVEVFAGLPGRYELHRVGGLADGEWKEALVPLPWDMLMRIPTEPRPRTALYLNAPAGTDVPVASLLIVDGVPSRDERRWARETRAWVARAQGEKRVRARRAPGKPVIPARLRTAALIPFVRSTSRLIHDHDAPAAGEAGAALALTMATNEIEPAQFGVYANGRDLHGVRVILREPGLVDGKGALLPADCSLFTAEYSVVKSGKLFPQRLWPAFPVDIPRGRSRMFWVNVRTRAGKARPGDYSGAIHIKAEGMEPVLLPIRVKVLPIRLLTMNEAGLSMGGCTQGLLPAHELRELVRHNMNSINLWYYGFEPKIIRRSATAFDLDFTICDDFMRHARAAGMANFVYFLGGNPYGWPDTMHLERELYRRVHRDGSDLMGARLELLRTYCARPGGLLPVLRPLYVQWVRKFMSHARAAGWPEPLLTPFDEPAKWVQGNRARAKLYYWQDKRGRDHVRTVRKRDHEAFMKRLRRQGIDPRPLGVGGADKWIKAHFKDSCAAIHEGWPRARVYASIHHAASGIVFLPDVEIFCTNAIHEDPRLGDKVRAEARRRPRAGVTFWQYSGTGDARLPAEGRYSFGFYFAAFGSRGALCWAYNWGRRFDTSVGNNWLYGWTTPYSVVRTPFWEGMREAWDDRRYVETCRRLARARGAGEQAEKFLQKLFDRVVATRAKGGRDTVNNFFARTRDPDALDATRAAIAREILRLQSR